MIQINPRYRNEIVYEEINQLIKLAINCIDPSSTTLRLLGHNIDKFTRYDLLLFNRISEITNYTITFNEIKHSPSSEFDLSPLSKILNGIRHLPLEQQNIHTLLIKINDEFQQIKNNSLDNFTYYFPINLKLGGNTSQIKKLRKNLNLLFNFKVIESSSTII